MDTKTKKGIASACAFVILFAFVIGLTSMITDKNTVKIKDYTDSEIAEILKDYSKYVTLCDLSEITYSLSDDYTVTDDDVTEVLLRGLPAELKSKKEITDKPAKKGDIVKIKYKGTIDSKSFTGSDSGPDGISFKIGHTNLIDGVEESVIGMKVNEKKNITVTYPDDYGLNEISGKTADFTIELISITEEQIINLTDETVKKHTKYQTVDELKTESRKALEFDMLMSKNKDSYNAIMKAIGSASEYKGFDEKEIDMFMADSYQLVAETARDKNISELEAIRMMFGKDIANHDEFDEIVKTQAEEYLKTKMLIHQIAHENNITVTADEFKEYKNNLMKQLNLKTEAELLNDYGKHMHEEEFVFNCLLNKVQKWLLENIKQK